jgi:essential nuclear protein 1
LGSKPKINLSERILENFKKEKEKNIEIDLEEKIPSNVISAYRKLAILLARYRSGKLPKAFTILPKLKNWEELLIITLPLNWSFQAVEKGTELFASQANPKVAQRFYNLVLLPKCRDNFMETGKLHFHLFLALKRSCYKPSAFYKGKF